MAGIGIELNRIFEKNTITTDLVGVAYSSAVTVSPMFVVIGSITLMGYVLGFNDVGYLNRSLFSCTVLYTFIFSLLTVSPFNAVLSKYMQDVIYEERYQDILPCYYLGLVMNMALSCLVGIPFCLWEHLVGGVEIFYVFIGFCTYISLILVFYSMIYLSICKDYQRISLYFLIGMVEAFILSLVLHFLYDWEITISMLFALMSGFFLIAVLEFTTLKRYFVKNSNRYLPILRYFGKWWQLVAANFLYMLGLYIHNFVFWTTDMRSVVVGSFVCNQSYDMAACFAMFTNISAIVIFVARVEMNFHEKYKAYSEAVIGGKGADIENTKKRMFRQLSGELMNLVRIQFIISEVVYLFCIIFLPQLGFAGMVMRIYPCLAAGYFILFLMYSAMAFLYYFNDLVGAVMTSGGFCAITLAGSIFATRLPEIWFGIGLVMGSFAGWSIAYMRLRWVERNLDTHIFCRGTLLEWGSGKEPKSMVYSKIEKDAMASAKRRKRRLNMTGIRTRI